MGPAAAGGSYDVVVLGGGPAGALAARELARAGHGVALVARPRRFAAWEGLAPRAVEILRERGCERALASLGPEVVRSLEWNGSRSVAGREWLTDRPRFDRGLLEDAADAGVRILAARCGATVRNRERWSVRTASGDLQARFLVEARGRDAPRRRASALRGPATTALARAWRLPRPRAAMTAVAGFPDGWGWFASGGGRRVVVQVVVSGRQGELPGRSDLAPHYRALLEGIAEARAWLDGAEPSGPVNVRAAAPRLLEPVVDAGRRMLRVGDAAMAVDPLSGNGVCEALESALAAIPSVATLLADPDAADLVKRYYRGRFEHAFPAHCRSGRDVYASEHRWRARPFWRARATWPDREPARPDPASGAAEAALRPVVAAGRIREAAVVVTADCPGGMWRMQGIALADLLALLRERGVSVEEAARILGARIEAVTAAARWLAYRDPRIPAPD